MTSSPKMPEYEIPNPQVRAHASQIADAAIFLYQHMLEIHCVPSVLLESALAIELYLKSLSSKTISHPLGVAGVESFQLTAAPTKRTHFLKDLFDAIDEPIRDELQRAYAKAPVIAGDLRNALSRYNNLFVDIRYAFEALEGGDNNITCLIDLVRFFRKVIDAMPTRYGQEVP